MKISKILMALSLAAAVAGCPAEEEEEENNNTASCGSNESDGTAIPSSVEAFELGTKKTIKACYSTGSRYFYYKATGMYLATDVFTVAAKLNTTTAGVTASLYIADKTGTYQDSDTAISSLSPSSPEETSTDESPVDTADSPSDALYILVYVNGPGTDNTAVDLEFTVTKNP